MQKDIFDRVKKEAEYIVETGATVRETAKVFSWGKSTVHKDVTERLYCINKSLYKKVQKVLQKNLSLRHIRGGEATRQKYLKQKGN